MKKSAYIISLLALFVIVCDESAGMQAHYAFKSGFLPPDSLGADSLRTDTIVKQDSVARPIRGRIMRDHRNPRNGRFTYINPLDSINAAHREAARAEKRKLEAQFADSLKNMKERAEQLKRDSLILKARQDSLDLVKARQDSIFAQAENDSIYGPLKALPGNRNDTIPEDTAQTKKGVLDFPVKYEAKDSTVYIPDEGYAHFFGTSKVNYQKIELASEIISMSLDSSIVRAHGVRDSLGVLTGKPVFKDGDTEYVSERMSYNFKTKKGFINNVDTKQGEGFLTSERSKKGANDEMFLEHGRYTTCDDEHPHFYIALSRAKVRPKKDVVFGPAWLVIEDVPLPFAIPFGFFPFSKSYSSGFIMPSYGDDSNRGFYLRDGGYYFAISDKMDLKLTGEIYTKGSWGLKMSTNYTKRYRYRGSFSADYQVYVTGEKNMPDYSKQKNFRIQWTHSQDPKSSPNSTFSASVNYSTSSYDKTSMSSLYDPTQYAQSQKTSSISYSRSFPDMGLTISTSANLHMSSRDSTISLTLPNLDISLSRFYPFKRKKAAGKERWYEKIAMSYTGSFSNSINTKENLLFHTSLVKDWRNGFRHSIPVQASFTIMKYITITPSLSYNERWYTVKEMRSWDEKKQVEVKEQKTGFNRVYDWNFSIGAETKLYGMYKPWKKLFGDKIQMIRHVVTPRVSYSYHPDFSATQYGFYETYLKTDAKGNVTTVKYSPFSSSLYGTAPSGKSGSINMSLSNNVEMKMKNKNDSIVKVSLIDELSANLSYNMAAKERQWSDLSMSIRLKLSKKFTFNMAPVFATYAYALNKDGIPYLSNETEWSHGRFGRFQGTSQHLSYTLNNDTFKKLFGKKTDKDKDKKKKGDGDEDDDAENEEKSNNGRQAGRGASHNEKAEVSDDGYMKFQMPWSLSISYSVTMSEDHDNSKFNKKTMRYPYKLTHQLNFSGNLKLSNAWNINYTSGYDFTYHRLSTTTINISRDLHCFALSGGLVLSSYGYTSYNFTIRATAGTLADALKWDKRSGTNNAVQWY
ncbi:MAG: putative LPS assembly protein LptD [Bacteroidales bacterium]|nr:putative LPS assembly protein LptD [Bacteroidales bacterium]